MRERHFLEVTKPKAIDLVASHKDLKLLTINADSTISEALEILGKYFISQIPVVDKGEIIGSLNDNFLFSRLVENNDINNQSVRSLMQPPFPIVGEKATIDEVSKLITKDNNAVLLRDLGGNMHIITKHDIIEAVAKM